MQRKSAQTIKKALRKHASRWLGIQTTTASAETLSTESDRGVIILTATQLEDAVTYYISERLTGLDEEDKEYFLGIGGPLGEFGTKVKLALGMEIIDKETYELLEIVGNMRSASTHGHREVTFETAVIRDAVSLLVDERYAKDIQNLDGKRIRLLYLLEYRSIMCRFSKLARPKGENNALAWLAKGKDEL